MRSSISSFDLAAPLKGLLAAIATIGAAWLVTPATLAFDDQPMLSATTLNELVTERYVLQHAARPVVFLGSSILTVVPPSNCRPDNVASLYLQGSSALTGVEIIHRIGARPEVVFFEATMAAFTPLDETLLNEVLVPPYWQVRATVPPLNHNRNWMVMLYRALQPQTPGSLDLPQMTTEEWSKQIEPRLAAYRDSNPSRLLVKPEEQKALVAAKVRALRAQGVRVILHWPIDPQLNQIFPLKSWLALLKSELSDFEWYDPPDDLPLYRWDGLHFLNGSGLHYFNYLMRRAGVPFQPKCEPPPIFGRPPPA
jgi:hypothetical protein